MCELSNTSQHNQEPRKDVINPLFDGREQFPKASPRGEVDCQRQDGVVNESVVKLSVTEQPLSQANNNLLISNLLPLTSRKKLKLFSPTTTYDASTFYNYIYQLSRSFPNL